MNARARQCLRQRGEQVLTLAEAAHPPSPCVSVCVMNAQTGWCEGCLRDLDEIARWGSATPQQQHAIWRNIWLRLEHQRIRSAG